MSCPGSVALEAGYPEKSSIYADYGTRAHSLAEQCLRAGNRAEVYIDQLVDGVQADWEMVDAVQIYVDYINAIPGATRFIERRVDFSRFVPGGFGTADGIVIEDTEPRTIHICDLKMGKGVQVFAEENSQLMLYAVGALDELDPIFEWTGKEVVKLHIIQPRINHTSTWEIPAWDLAAWANNVVKPAAERALADDAALVPSEKACRFCRASADCPALGTLVTTTAMEGFDSVAPVAVETALEPAIGDLDRLGYLLSKIDLVRAWCNAIEDRAKELMLEQHVEIPGWKVVEGRGSRDWNDEAAAEKALKRALGAKEVYVSKLISPAQAEKKLGKDHYIIGKYVSKKSGSPTVAPEGDKRAAINHNHAADFETVA